MSDIQLMKALRPQQKNRKSDSMIFLSGIARRPTVCKAVGDMDQILADWAEKFEKTENKPVVVGWVAGSFSAFIVTEWLIHLPALDILLGFPVQLLGVLSLPLIITRYVLDGKDAMKDAGDLVSDIAKRLPGL
jgi:hypothetical protein